MQNQPENKRSRLREFFAMNEVAGYFFRKNDPDRPSSFNLKMMHGINKISILMFLAAFIIWLVRRLA